MKEDLLFQKQQPKLKQEALVRSLLCGLAVGLGANFVTALITWMLPINGLLLSLGVLVAVTAVATLIFYKKRFCLDNAKSARIIDRLGLEERMITMVELGNDDSFIAKIQREDAKAALAAIDNKQLKIRISNATVIAVVICGVLGVGMTTVNVLSEAGILPGGDKLLENMVEEQKTVYVSISYVAGVGGMIEGDEAQILVQGTNASAVTAVADDGYMFKCWSDGNKNPTRMDILVNEDVTYTAEFVEVEDEEGDDEGENQGDKPSDAPGGDQTGDGDGQSEDPQEPQDSESNGAGGAWEPNNQIINGETYYRDVLEEYQDAAEELLQNPDSGLTDEERELIKKYLGIV